MVLRGWVSTGQRGYQYTNDFAASLSIYRESAAFRRQPAAGTDGGSILAMRPMHPAAKASGDPAIVRFDLGGSTLSTPSEVFRLDRLLGPSYWDAGADLVGAMVGPSSNAIPGDRLSAAPGGDLFVGASLYDAATYATPNRRDWEGRISSLPSSPTARLRRS